MKKNSFIDHLLRSTLLNTDWTASLKDGVDTARAVQNYLVGLSDYMNEFMNPMMSASRYLMDEEKKNALAVSPSENLEAQLQLLRFNMDVAERGFSGTWKFLNDYLNREGQEFLEAWRNTLLNGEGATLKDLVRNRMNTLNRIAHEYPMAIREVGEEFGFHFERGQDKVMAETDRFILYRITPTDSRVTTDDGLKPVVIIPPYVLGANILGFLPHENKSYAHAFANQGIPTYIRILKPVADHPAVQTMEGEDDARDLKYFCEQLKKLHGQPVTLNGYCQGGFIVVCDMVTGELDGLVDTLISCVAPIDGSKCAGLANFLKSLPPRYNNLAYGRKTLPSGNAVADGHLMSWVYKLKSIDTETPIVSFFRDMIMLGQSDGQAEFVFNKTATALNYWLKYDRTDIPLGITKMSFASFNHPIEKDGTLPVTLFGKKLNIKRLKEKKIPWLICYGESDDLVEAGSALAPLDFMDVEVTPFPKGHVVIATSWSNPHSAYGLHKVYGESGHRGPVRFQLDQGAKKR